MARPLQLLIVGDSDSAAELWASELGRAGFAPEWVRVETEAQFIGNLHAGLELVLSDYETPQLGGLRALGLLRARGLNVPFILVSGQMGEEQAVQAMKRGATDYLTKDRVARLGPAVEHALGEARLRRERLKAVEVKAQVEFQLKLLETCVARLNDLVLITEAEPQDEPGPRILYVNEAFVRRTGYARAEVIGRSPRFLQGPKTSRAELDRIHESLRLWQPVRAELVNYTKSGEEFWLELDIVPIADAKGWFTHWVAVERDVTERKRAEQVLHDIKLAQDALAAQLEIERSRLVAAQAVAKVGSWETNLATLEVTWSAETFRIFEATPARFQPTHAGFLGFVHPEDRRAVDEAFVGSVSRAGPFCIQHRLALADGRIKIVEENWQIFPDDQGQPTRAIGTCQDITVRKRAEEALRALAGRLQVIREEERSGISREIHDVLAQELTRLKLDLTWMARRVVEPVNELTRVELAQKVGSMLELVDVTIESTQKLATDLRPVVLDRLGLGPAIEWLVSDFQLRTGVACAAQVPRDLPDLDGAQATAIFRIVQESLTNVIRHAAARHVWITLEADDRQLRLAVRDDGRGITPEELANPKSIGLLGMKERAALLGGATEIGPAAGGGTMVRVISPLPALSKDRAP